MPEAAEVTVAARQLGDVLVDRPLGGLTVTHPRTSRAQPAESLGIVVGRTVADVHRHGKWIVIRFVGLDEGLGVHLRMSGQLLLRAPTDVPPDRHVHAVFDVGDRVVWFRDPRTFGELRLLDGGAPVAPDLFDAAVTVDALVAAAARRSVGVKAMVLDQVAVMSGVGSYLADEALHAVGVSPMRPSNAVSPGEWEAILEAIRGITRESAAVGGVTLADEGWVDLYGRSGRFAEQLRVHARTDCRDCGTPTRRATVGGRSARWCPACQPI